MQAFEHIETEEFDNDDLELFERANFEKSERRSEFVNREIQLKKLIQLNTK